MSKSKRKQHQPFTILIVPTLVNKERVYPTKGILIKKADNQFYVYNLETGLFTSWFFGAISVAFGIWTAWGGGELNLEYGIFSGAQIIIGLFFFIYGLTADKKKKKTYTR